MPGFELQWKTTLESPARHGVSLGAGVVASGVNIFTPLSIIGAPSNQVFAVDNDTGNLFWTRRFEGTLAAGTAACPGGISGTLTRMVNLTTPAPGAGKGRRSRKRVLQQRRRRAWCRRADSGPRRRRSRERPAVGNTSGCGGNDTATAGCRAGLAAAVNDSARSNPSVTVPDERGRTRIRRGLWRPSGVVYAVSADGMFRTLGLVSGKDVQRPAPFVPAGARFSDLIAVNDKVYTATSGGCGGAADGVWAIDIASDTKLCCLVEDQRRLSARVCRLHHQRHRHRGDWPRQRHCRGLRERDRRARSEDARRRRTGSGSPVSSSRRRPCCFRSLARTSSPSRPGTDAFCCSTPAHSAARITTRRCLRRRHLLAAPRPSRRSHRRCGRSAHQSPPQPGRACCFLRRR